MLLLGFDTVVGGKKCLSRMCLQFRPAELLLFGAATVAPSTGWFGAEMSRCTQNLF